MKHFTHKELASKDNNVVELHPVFELELERLRDAWGKPMKVNSCCRSVEHNKAVGGHPASLHLYEGRPGELGTAAIDIAFNNSPEKMELAVMAWDLGWSIGFARTFLHLDRRTEVRGLDKTIFTY